MRRISQLLTVIVIGCAIAPALAQDALDHRVNQLEYRVGELDRKVQDAAGPGIALVLFGAFCALWAQNTKRNSWLWFFLGLFFSVITVFVLLYKNAKDRKLP
jgi:hypothetical protein